MPTISMFLLCDAITPTIQGAPQLSSPALVLRPLYIPGNFSFGLAVGVCGIDLNRENHLKVTIVDPKGEVIYQQEGPLPASIEPETIPSQYAGFIVSLDVRNLPIHREGVHKLKVYINGELIKEEKEIPIFKK